MSSAQHEKTARRDLIEVCRLSYSRGYICGTEGNFSIRLDENSVLTTPRGTCKGRIKESDLVVTDLAGMPLHSSSSQRNSSPNHADRSRSSKNLYVHEPSTELKMHLIAYRQRDDIWAVVHAHPTFAVGFTVAQVPLPERILPEVICTLGDVPVAPYATPSTDEVPQSIRDLVKEHDALLLDHHGALTVGTDIWDAFYKLETLEHYAQTVLVAHLLGGAKQLTALQVKKLMEIRDTYRIQKPTAPVSSLNSQFSKEN